MVSVVIVLSTCHFAEFDTSVVLHELILCLGSFLLQGMFQALLVLCLGGQSFKYSTYMLLTILYYMLHSILYKRQLHNMSAHFQFQR